MKNYDNFNFEEFKKKTQNGYLAIATEEEWKGFIKYLAAYYRVPLESFTTPSYELLQNGLGVFWNETYAHTQAFTLDEVKLRANHPIKYTMEDFCHNSFVSSEDEVLKFIKEI